MEASEIKAFRDGDKVTIIIQRPTQQQLDQISRICKGGIDEVVGFKHRADAQVSQKAQVQPVDQPVSEPETKREQPSAAEVVPAAVQEPQQEQHEDHGLEQAIKLSRSMKLMSEAGAQTVRDTLVRYLSKDRQGQAKAAWKDIRQTKSKDDPKAIGDIANVVVKLFWEQYGRK